jgi:hypothetical protein
MRTQMGFVNKTCSGPSLVEHRICLAIWFKLKLVEIDAPLVLTHSEGFVPFGASLVAPTRNTPPCHAWFPDGNCQRHISIEDIVQC